MRGGKNGLIKKQIGVNRAVLGRFGFVRSRIVSGMSPWTFSTGQIENSSAGSLVLAQIRFLLHSTFWLSTFSHEFLVKIAVNSLKLHTDFEFHSGSAPKTRFWRFSDFPAQTFHLFFRFQHQHLHIHISSWWPPPCPGLRGCARDSLQGWVAAPLSNARRKTI
jgi:hypothetical protein